MLAAEAKNKKIKMMKQGKLTAAQILADRQQITPTSGDLAKSGETQDERAEMWERRRSLVSKDTFAYRSRSGNRLFRTKNGSPFVVRDLLDEYFVTKFKAVEYTPEEIVALGQPNQEGWITSNPSPLGEVKKKLLQLMNEPEKWLHFNITKGTVHTDLFFSPKKDRWFYIELNPTTGLCRRSQIFRSKAVAEFKRAHQLIDWVSFKNPISF